MYNESIYQREDLPSSRVELYERLLSVNQDTFVLPSFQALLQQTKGYVPLVLENNTIEAISKHLADKDIEEVKEAVRMAIVLYKDLSGTRPTIHLIPKKRKKPELKRF